MSEHTQSSNGNEFTTHEQLIRAFGAEIARAVKWWRPIRAVRCINCGSYVYYITTHDCPRKLDKWPE